MASSFPRNARFLTYLRPGQGNRVYVTFSAWAYRVTAPLVPRRGLDLFQRVVLGLCEAGVRTPDRLNELTELHPRLCAHIVDRARHEGLLDRDGEPTERGRAALRTGTIDEDTEWSVRYVFHDPVTQDLWPRAAERLSDAYVLKAQEGEVVVELGSAGRRNRVRALRMPAGEAAPKAPRPEQVLEVVRRDRQARINARTEEFARRNGLGPLDAEEEQATYGARIAPDEPLPQLARISFIGDPEPVEILGVIEVAGPDMPGEGWVPHDPFGVGTNAMFGQLIERWATEHSELAERLGQLFKEQGAPARADLSKSTKLARAQAGAELVKEFGARLREDAAVREKLIDLRTAAYDQDAERARRLAVVAAFGLFEETFYRLAVAYPMPRNRAEPLRQRAAERRRSKKGAQKPQPLWASNVAQMTIRKAAEQIGVYDLPYPALMTTSDDLGRLASESPPSEGTKFSVLVTAALISAEARDDHPLRRMVGRRPDLLFEIDVLRQMRNGQGHRLGQPSVAEDLRWCEELAAVAAPELLDVPAAT